ncbi:MAG: SpvB/TcaC N-terminal domain-containing protein [Lentimicrobiaceae bacterium]|nr:SpvB/TcaC N-terminal domain-containing protein [Lentimicrobiaceae bacterium]
MNKQLYGQQEYQASQYIDMINGFGFKASSQNDFFHAKIDPFMVFPPEGGEFGGPSADDNGAVGSMGGSYSVSSNGAATYNLPIEVPVGINGMQPQLAVSYNSQAGNGIMGIGWNLNGLSAITRTGSTLFNDKINKGVKYNDEDHFALDGNRLVGFSGTYGQNGAEYRTELETYSKIISYRSSGTAPDYFVVWTKSGQIIEYGRTGDSRIELQGTSGTQALIGTWLVNKISDRFGNSIEFNYLENNATGEFVIDKIKYGGNPDKGIPMQCEVRFQYRDDRKDKIVKYIFPQKINSLTKLLDRIEIYVENTKQYHYKFDYKDDEPGSQLDFTSKLKNIKRTQADGVALNPVEFDYHPDAPLKTERILSEITYCYEYNGLYYVYDGNKSLFADFNGDGKLDIMIVYRFWDENVNKVAGFKLYYASINNYIPGPGGSLPNREFIRFLPCNINGDQKTDLLMVRYKTLNDPETEIVPYISNENNVTGFDIEPSFRISMNPSNILFQVDDFNGDGKSELLAMIFPFPDADLALFTTYSFQNEPTFSVVTHTPKSANASINHYYETRDMDADGIPELIRLKSDGMYVYKFLFEPGGQTISDPVHYSFPTSAYQVYWADFNADGYCDILFRDKSTGLWGIQLFTGSDFIPVSCPVTLTEDPSNNRVSYSLLDYNGDGLVDINERYLESENPKKFRNTFFYNTGNGFRSESFYTYDIDHDIRINPIERTTDMNGDGINDVIYQANNDYNPSLVYLVAYEVKSKDKSNLIEVIRDEFDNETTFTYKHLPYCTGDDQTEPEYVKYTDSSYPFMDFQGAMSVVTKVSAFDGLGNQPDNIREIKYHYEGAKIHLKGKGYLGFMKTMVEDVDAGSWSETTNKIEENENYIFPHPDITRSYVKINGQDKKLNETKYTYYVHNKPLQSLAKHYAPYQTKVHSKNWNEKGEYEKTVRTERFYLGNENALTYGNPYKVLELGSENELDNYSSSSAFRFGKEASTFYPYTTSLINQWVVANPDSVRIRYFMNGAADITECEYFDYYPIGDPRFPLLMTSRVHPEHNSEIRTEFDYNQALGLIIKKTITAPNYTPVPEARVERYEYNPDYGYRFMTKQFNPLNHAAESIIDPVKGTMVKSIDANNFNTDFGYDSFNRPVKEVSYDGIITSSVLRWANGHQDSKPGALWYKWSCASGQKPQLIFYDRLGREIRSVSYTPSGQKIYIEKEYDHFGRLVMVSDPHLPGETQYLKTTTTYDELNRPKVVKHPGDIAELYAYGQRSVTITNDHGKTTKKVTDAAGRIVSSTDEDNKYVGYTYYSNGKLNTTKINGNASTLVTLEYDINGNNTKTTDPSWGTNISRYNPFNELVYSEDARQNKYAYTYDVLGRTLSRKNLAHAADLTNWLYEETAGKLGLLKSESNLAGHLKLYTYGKFNRLVRVTEQLDADGMGHDVSYAHDELGRVSSMSYPDGLTLSYRYTDDGVLKKIIRERDAVVVWEGVTYNDKGQLTQSKRGNNFLLDKTYYPETGLLHTSMCTNVQSFEYVYDNLGNMTDRYDHFHKTNHQSLHEEFGYDDRNQLTSVTLNGASPRIFIYDALGNIESNPDAGAFVYTLPGKPYQMASLTPNSNLAPDYQTRQEITYTHFNKVETITSQDHFLEVTYGIDQQRISQKLYEVNRSNKNFILEKQFIAGIAEKIIFADQTSKIINYITSPEGLTAIEITSNPEGREWYWVFTDHLGSITTLLRESDGQKFEMSFDAWGNRRDPATWENYSTTFPDFIIDRGFTGHEHLDVFGLINMNGRVYDPVVARFLSPDPYIQAPGMPQNYNGYVYCLNNPLVYTDPSGEFIVEAIILGAMINTMIQGASGNINSFGDFALAMGIGALSGAAGYVAGALVGGAISTATTFGGAVLNGAAVGAAGGFAGGFVGGAGNAWAGGASFGQGLEQGLIGGGIGALGGAIIGGIAGGVQYNRQMTLFQQGCETLGVEGGDAVPATDKFLSDAQQSWYKDAPMDKVGKFTTENVPAELQLKMDQAGAPGATRYLQRGGVLTGRSNVYFNKNLAFSSAKQLYFTMGHELVHVSQYAALAGQPTSILRQSFVYNGQTVRFNHDLMEFHAYSYQNSLGGTQLNSFPPDLVRAMAKQWPSYFNMLGYTNFGWTGTTSYIYPF